MDCFEKIGINVSTLIFSNKNTNFPSSINKGIQCCQQNIEFINDIITNKNNKYNCVNQLVLYSVLKNVVKNDMQELLKTIIFHLNIYSCELRDKLKEKLNTGTYNNSVLFEIIKEYVKFKNDITMIFYPIKRYFMIDNNNIIDICGKYIFYINFFSEHYFSNISNTNIDIMKIFFENWDKSIGQYLSIVKTIKFYRSVDSFIKIDDCAFDFNQDKYIESKDFTEKIVEYIHQKIVGLKISQNNNKKENIVKIIDCLTFYVRNINKQEFITLYCNKMIERLFSNCDYKIEEEFSSILNIKKYKDGYLKICSVLRDMKVSENITEKIHSLNKFGNSDINKYNFYLIKRHIWDRKKFENITFPTYESTLLPDEVFKSITNKINTNFMENIEYNIDHEKSIFNFELEINGKKCVSKCNVLQMNILQIILKKNNTSAKEIVEILKLKNIKDLTVPINSLIVTKFIIRDTTLTSNNPEMTFSINKNINFDSNFINLAEVYDNLKKKHEEDQKEEYFKMKTCILSLFVENKCFTLENLIEKLNTKKKQLVENIISELISETIITQLSCGIYVFKNDNNSDDSDSDNDSDNDSDDDENNDNKNKNGNMAQEISFDQFPSPSNIFDDSKKDNNTDDLKVSVKNFCIKKKFFSEAEIISNLFIKSNNILELKLKRVLSYFVNDGILKVHMDNQTKYYQYIEC